MLDSDVGYVLVENKETGHQAIKLTNDPYSGIMFVYGKVELNDDSPTLKFEYEMIEDIDTVYNKEAFEKYIGDLLVELIQYGLENNDITYTGGVDE